MSLFPPPVRDRGIALPRPSGQYVRCKGGRAEEMSDQGTVLEPGLVSQASGSAYIEAGNSKIVCAVYGPHPARRDAPFSPKARLNVEARFAPFACKSRRRIPGKDAESSELSGYISQALLPAVRLDLMPKSVIDVYITILECDGAEDDASLSVTAASAALVQAGVEVYGLVIGTSLGVTETSELWHDPTHVDLPACSRGFLQLAYLPALGTTTSIIFDGDLDRGSLLQAIEQLKSVSERYHTAVAKQLISR